MRGLFPRQIPTKGIYNLIDYTSTSDVSLSLSTEGAPHRIMCSFSDGHDKVVWASNLKIEIVILDLVVKGKLERDAPEKAKLGDTHKKGNWVISF